MSAPGSADGRKSPEAVAKRRETQRPKSLGELKAAVQQVGEMFRHCADDCPRETYEVGWLFVVLADYVTTRRLPPRVAEQLEVIRWAVCEAADEAPRPMPMRAAMAVTIDQAGLDQLKAAIDRRVDVTLRELHAPGSPIPPAGVVDFVAARARRLEARRES